MKRAQPRRYGLRRPLGAGGLVAAFVIAALANDVLADESILKIRPTTGDSTVHTGYGDAEVFSYASASGRVLVWWSDAAEHRPPLLDVSPADDIPDFVQRVAETADAVLENLVATGFREPIADTISGGPRDNGGGGEFDIYLVNFERADGLFFAEACTDETPARCAGYIAMENDFARSGYASQDEAIGVLVSHEFFHAVQAAYSGDLPAWWSEGTATWHEEYFDASQRDFERLASEYFEHPGRSLNGPIRGNFDTYSYGTAVFPFFLERRFGVDLLVRVFELIATGEAVEAAVIAEVDAVDSFDDAFAEFAAWTLVTGERTIDGFGFPMASDFAALSLTDLDGGVDFNWEVAVPTWSVQPAELSRPRDLVLGLRAVEGWPDEPILVVVDPVAAVEERVSFVYVGEVMEVSASDAPVFVAVVNPLPSGETAGRVTVRAVSTPSEPDAEGSGEGSGAESGEGGAGSAVGSEPSGCSAGAGPYFAWWPVSLALCVFCWRRRRVDSLAPVSPLA